MRRQCRRESGQKSSTHVETVEEKLFFVDEKEMDTVVNCILHYDLANLIHDV